MQGRGTDPSVRADAAVDSVLHGLMSIGRLMRQRVPGDPLDPGTFLFLKHLDRHGDLRLTDLASCADLDVSTVSRHVAQLHRQGLVERTPDPEDRRAQRVTLSRLGTSLLDEAVARRHELLSRSLKGWEPADVDHLARLLARFARGVEDVNNHLESS